MCKIYRSKESDAFLEIQMHDKVRGTTRCNVRVNDTTSTSIRLAFFMLIRKTGLAVYAPLLSRHNSYLGKIKEL